MKLKFNDYDYHLSKDNAKDDKMIDNIIKASFNELNKTKLKGYKSNIENQFKKYSKTYTKFEKEQLIHKIVKGIVKEIYNLTPEVEDKHLFNTVRTQLSQLLPIVLENEKSYFINSNFLYEPMNIYILYLLNKYYYKSINKEDREIELLSDDYYVFQLYICLFRNLRSSLLLLANCDDAHSISISRGTIEIFAKLSGLNEENIDTYKKYLVFNRYLQSEKTKLDIHNEKLYKEYKELTKGKSKSALENLFLVGWYKNKKGKPTATISDFINETLGKEYVDLYHSYSEFVHEDYVFNYYNYIDIRKNQKYFIGLLTIVILQMFYNANIFKFTAKDLDIIEKIKNNPLFSESLKDLVFNK